MARLSGRFCRPLVLWAVGESGMNSRGLGYRAWGGEDWAVMGVKEELAWHHQRTVKG